MFTKTETVSAIDAAKRQLKEAITLFFEQRDSVSVHTLAAASHEILSRFAQAKDVKGLLENRENFNKKEWELYIKWLRKWRNFFKHGNKNKDPNASIEFPFDLNVCIIHDCCHLYHQVVQEPFWETEVWLRWVGIKYPDFIKDGTFKRLVIEQIPSSVDPDDFDLFLDYLKEGNKLGI